ncbi:MAG TPA: EAL domain-containing protein [Bacillota bacterium]|nr:EAL domain-containing protein [Bacillota bacterium]
MMKYELSSGNSSTNIVLILLLCALVVLFIIFLSLLLGRRRQRKKLIASENERELVKMLLRSMNAGLFVSENDEKRTLRFVNDNIDLLLGYSPDEFIQVLENSLLTAVIDEDRELVRRQYSTGISSSKEFQLEYRMRAKDGRVIWVQETARQFVDTDGILRINSVVTDISPLKETLEELRVRAEYDECTGIYNRYAFFTTTRRMLDENPDKDYILIRWDIARFRVFNDVFGVEAGDELLRVMAQEIKRTVDGRGTYGRIEADHFAICIEESLIDIPSITTSIAAELKKYPYNFEISPSFGIYQIKKRELPVEIMSDRAALALRSVKGNFVRLYAYYDDNMRADLVREQEIVNEMRSALESGKFCIYLQPQFNHATGKLFGAEALVRWNHPTKGLISPGSFIPIFEKNGFITQLDEYIWECACVQISEWLKADKMPVPISVNISRLDLYNTNLITVLEGLLEKYKVPHELLRLEITESAYVENPIQLIGIVKQLQALGYHVEMDDFGSGYSSLNTLKDVPVDLLKIDMKFLEKDKEYGRGGSILNSIVRMAKWLRLPVLAEGVETIEQADFLKSIGCNLVQGYFYSRPIPTSEFAELMTRFESDSSIQLNKMFGTIESDDFWDPTSYNSLIFNHFVGGAGVFEYYNGKIETLRTNDRFFSEIETHRELFESYRLNILSSIAASDKPILLNAIKKAIATADMISCECRWIDAEAQEIRWLTFRIRIIAKSTSRYVFYADVTNITEQKNASLELERTTHKFEAVMNSIQGGIAIFDANQEYRLIYCNPGWYRMLGYTENDFEGNHDAISGLMYRDDAQLLREKCMDIRKTGKPFSFEYRMYHKSGRVLWIKSDVTLMHDVQDTDDVRLLATSTDITSTKEVMAHLESVMQNVPFGIAVFEKRARPHVIFANPRFFEQNGYSHDEIIQDDINPYSIIHPDDRDGLAEYVKKHLTTGLPFEYEFRTICKSGNVKWTHMIASEVPYSKSTNHVYIAVFTDTTPFMLANENLKARYNALHEMYDNIPCGILHFEFSKKMNVISVNQAMKNILSINDESAFMCAPPFEWVEKEDRDIFTNIFSSFIDEAEGNISHSVPITFRAKRSDSDEVLWLTGEASVCIDLNNTKIIQLAVVERISEEHSVILAKQHEQERYRIIVEQTGVTVIEWDDKRGVFYYSDSYKQFAMSQYQPKTLVNEMRFKDVVHHEDVDIATRFLISVRNHTHLNECIVRAKMTSGGYKWIRMNIICVTGDEGNLIRAIGTIAIIDENKRKQEALRIKAEYDSLTGLFNRPTTIEHISLRMREEQAYLSIFVVFDIDHFKSINDRYGHLKGDELLHYIGELALSSFRKTDVVGRIGGDEFVIYFDQIKSMNMAIQRISQFQERVAASSDMLGFDSPVTLSIGIAEVTSNDDGFAAIFGRADHALYMAKNNGRNQYCIAD